MGIYDREYIRVGPRSTSGMGGLRFISFNTWLILINAAVFLVQYAFPTIATVPGPTGQPAHVLRVGLPRDHWVTPQISPMDAVTYYGHFSTFFGFQRLEVWRLVTFQFLHGGLMHLFFNMFGLWVFGGMVEQYLGFRRYAAFYLVCGIFGGVSYLILNLLGAGAGLKLPGVLINDLHTPLVGASAGVFGVIMACAYIAPNAVVQLVFPPIPLRLKWFAYGYVAIALFNLIAQGQNAGGDAAHIGGAIAGFFFIRNAHLLRDFFDIFGDSRKGRRVARARPDAAEVDRILSKLHTDGFRSLTDAEKVTLRRDTESRRA